MNEQSVNGCHALIISPHPDDADLGIGGTVAAWTGEGKKVIYIICTSGEKGTDNPKMEPMSLARMREKEQVTAAEKLGVMDVVFLHYQDIPSGNSSHHRSAIPGNLAQGPPHNRTGSSGCCLPVFQKKAGLS
jgi:LmbE family N-acetylglucosaminyl deacetylase